MKDYKIDCLNIIEDDWEEWLTEASTDTLEEAIVIANKLDKSNRYAAVEIYYWDGKEWKFIPRK
jgi:hypothetical protein